MVDQETFLDTAPSLYERIRLAEPGTISRSENWWVLRRCDDDPEIRSGASASRYVIASRDGEPVGYVAYRTKDDYTDGVSNGEVRIREIAALDLEAELAIWNFIFSIDLITKIKVYARPIDDPLLHRLENSRAYQRKVSDALYLAVMDVPAALEGRTFSAPGSLAIEITDQDTAGVYQLTVDDDGTATCARQQWRGISRCKRGRLAACTWVGAGSTRWHRQDESPEQPQRLCWPTVCSRASELP